MAEQRIAIAAGTVDHGLVQPIQAICVVQPEAAIVDDRIQRIDLRTERVALQRTHCLLHGLLIVFFLIIKDRSFRGVIAQCHQLTASGQFGPHAHCAAKIVQFRVEGTPRLLDGLPQLCRSHPRLGRIAVLNVVGKAAVAGLCQVFLICRQVIEQILQLCIRELRYHEVFLPVERREWFRDCSRHWLSGRLHAARNQVHRRHRYGASHLHRTDLLVIHDQIKPCALNVQRFAIVVRHGSGQHLARCLHDADHRSRLQGFQFLLQRIGQCEQRKSGHFPAVRHIVHDPLESISGDLNGLFILFGDDALVSCAVRCLQFNALSDLNCFQLLQFHCRKCHFVSPP